MSDPKSQIANTKNSDSANTSKIKTYQQGKNYNQENGDLQATKRSNIRKQTAKNANKTKFEGCTPGLEGHIFYYGPGMGQKYITSREKILIYIGRKYTASEVISLDTGTLTLANIQKPHEYKTKTSFKQEPFWLQEKWKIDMKRYGEAEHSLIKNLSSCYSIIWGQVTMTMRSKIQASKQYKMVDTNKDAIGLLQILGDICNNTTTIEHEVSRNVNSLYNLLNISGNNTSLADYHDNFMQRKRASETYGVEFASPKLMTSFLTEKLAEVGGDPKNQEYTDFKDNIKEITRERVLALIFLRQSGDRFEQYRREIRNDFSKGSDHFPLTVSDAQALLQSYEITDKPKANNGNNKTSNNNRTMNFKKALTETDDTNAKPKSGLGFQQKDFT